MRTPLAVLTLACLLGSCDHFRSFESVCEQRVAPTRITVDTVPVRFETDLTQSHDDLSRKDSSQPHLLTLGLVVAEMKTTVEYAANGIVQRRTGRYCMRPSVRVTLSYAPMTLYVAREQSEGSCEFELTMQHELKHVRTFDAFLPDVAAQIGESLGAALGNHIKYFQSEAEADRHVQEITRDFLGPFVSDSMSKVKGLQAEVDSPGEYQRIRLARDACRDEAQSR